MKDITSKYKDMIEAFECDFNLSQKGSFPLEYLQEKIDNKNERILNDIELLSELSFILRHNQAKIMLVEDSDIK